MDVLPLGLTGDGALRAAVAADREVTRMEGVRLDHLGEYLLETAQAWVPPVVRAPGVEELVAIAGPGAPAVPEFAVCEVAAGLGISQPAATGLCADVLDLTCRLRRLAAAVRCGDLPFVRARMIARRTRVLSAEQAGLVEAKLMRSRETGRGPVPVAALVPMGRLRTMVDQTVLTVRGPQSEAEAEAVVATSLFVEVVHEAGGATDLAARLAAADAARLDVRLDEIAGWLTGVGDARPKAVLRAVALGLLADPDLLETLRQVREEQRNEPLSAPTSTPTPLGGASAGARIDGPLPRPAPLAPQAEPEPGAARAPQVSTAAGIAGLPPQLLEKFARLRSTVLYVHLDRASATWCEESAGALSRTQARAIVGHSAVSVRPVLDLAEPLAYTGYVAPPRLKEQRTLLNAGYCTFPHCQRRARPGDVDHQHPARLGGATESVNTHKLCRKHHRAKDKGGWQVTSPAPGVWIWRSPAGGYWLVTNGTTTPMNGLLTHPPDAMHGALTQDEHDHTHGFIDTG